MLKCPSSAHVVVLTHVYLLPLVHSQAHNIPAYYEVTTSYHRNNVCHNIIIIIILLLTLWTCTAIGVTIIPLYTVATDALARPPGARVWKRNVRDTNVKLS